MAPLNLDGLEALMYRAGASSLMSIVVFALATIAWWYKLGSSVSQEGFYARNYVRCQLDLRRLARIPRRRIRPRRLRQFRRSFGPGRLSRRSGIAPRL